MSEVKGIGLTEKNVLAHELIGLEAKVLQSSDPSRKRVIGKVVDETRNILRIETGEKEVVLPKKECVFGFVVRGKIVEVDGKKICMRPEERVKQYWRKAL